LNFYSCPKCHKEISGPFDTEYTMLSFGLGALIKDTCPFCGISVSIKWLHYLFASFSSLAMAGLLFVISLKLYNITPAKVKIPITAALIPFSLFNYYIFVLMVWPKILGTIGVTLYKHNKNA
jgi:hypothetical protein